jgi:hypothetical protein
MATVRSDSHDKEIVMATLQRKDMVLEAEKEPRAGALVAGKRKRRRHARKTHSG